MQAIILVGGLGTRLHPLVGDRNKPMAPVSGKPFLEYVLRQLKKSGVVDVILCAAYRAELIRDHFRLGDALSLRIRYSYEEDLRGTAGALKLAEALIDDDEFIVMNGDSFFDVHLERMIASHRDRRAIATLALAEVPDTQRFGAVEIDQTGRIHRFVEKGHTQGSGLINGGIYVLQREVLAMIPEGRVTSLEYDIFPALIGRGFYGVPFRDYFVDIGVPVEYRKLQSDPTRLIAAVS